MKDLGSLTYFLGLEVYRSSSGISLNQHKYASDLVATAGLQEATSVDTPMELNIKLRKEEGDLLVDPSLYRKLVGSLVYLTITRLDISFAVQQVSQFLQTPRHLHLAAVHRIIRYVQGTSARGLFFPAGNSPRLVAYSDADWAGCADTHHSITGWCVFLGDALVSWKSKKQDRVSKSSTESEYRAMSLACSKIIWLRGLLAELDFSETDPTPLHADNTIINSESSNDAWHVLETLYGSHTRDRIQQMKGQLQSLNKGSSSLEDYLHKVKSLALYLQGVGFEFDPILAALNAQDIFPRLEGVIGKLRDFKIHLQVAWVTSLNVAFYTNRGRTNTKSCGAHGSHGHNIAYNQTTS
ncbi:uncharacterized mitochondrial protein AtMg00810-like [Carya illinoinensis]|uniref:uncharacterized mitochondrial protein AtMg00810-like n=1 Tax=Carya illinoinensis TaxID=32201 RepID=UPI001C7253AE|nr:uncharacterized mitochondrial protein AtMg00810-like [Carya illinoinensis]